MVLLRHVEERRYQDTSAVLLAPERIAPTIVQRELFATIASQTPFNNYFQNLQNSPQNCPTKTADTEPAGTPQRPAF